MAIQTFTTGQVLTAAQMNTLQTSVATYSAIGSRTAALTITTNTNSSVVDTTNFSGTITAAAGDLLQATWSSYIGLGTNVMAFNFYTFNGATAVNPFVSAPSFNPFYYGTGIEGTVVLTALYKCVAGDIFSNQVTVKLTCNTANNARGVVNGAITSPFSLTNLGKVQ